MTQEENISLGLLQKQLADRDDIIKKISATLHADGGGGPHMPGLDNLGERLAKLEGLFGGIKQVQEITLVAVGLLATFVVQFGVYELQKIDLLNDKVNDLPGKISTELRGITNTLAEAITAAKQQPPQVILVPAPQPPSPQPPPKHP